MEWVGSEQDPSVIVVDGTNAVGPQFAKVLAAEGFRIGLAKSGDEGLQAFDAGMPDLVMVHAQLTDMSGLALMRRIRRVSPVPVIVVAERGDENEAVLAFEMGASDYVRVQIGVREAAARMRVALSACSPVSGVAGAGEFDERGRLHAGPVELDLGRREVLVRGRVVHLGPKDFVLLATLVSNAGFVITRDRLIAGAWPDGRPAHRGNLNTHIRRLRAAVEPDPSNPRHILTVPGAGLRFDP